MPRIAKQFFRLQTQERRFVEFSKGQTIPEEFEDHWYVKDNSDEVAPPAAPVAAPAPVSPAPEPAPVVEPEPAAPEPVAQPEPESPAADDASFDGMTKEELAEFAVGLGIEVDGRWGAARIRAEIDAATTK